MSCPGLMAVVIEVVGAVDEVVEMILHDGPVL